MVLGESEAAGGVGRGAILRETITAAQHIADLVGYPGDSGALGVPGGSAYFFLAGAGVKDVEGECGGGMGESSALRKKAGAATEVNRATYNR